jgi:hypothetical protein
VDAENPAFKSNSQKNEKAINSQEIKHYFGSKTGAILIFFVHESF